MFRSVFAAVGGLALIVSTIITPAIAKARRCPVEPPSTLLSLYRGSDAIYLGTFDKTVDGDVVREENDYKVVASVDHYTISTTLKGEPRKFFEREREDYKYSQSVVAETPATDESADGSSEDEMATEEVEEIEEGEEGEEEFDEDYQPVKEGDTVILFLRRSGEEGEDGKSKLELAHYRDGIKRMPAASLSSYEARIKDLNQIFSKQKPDDAAIVAWLIRCIEDPVTRWEGAFELLNSFEALEWREEQAKEEAERAKEEAESDKGATSENKDVPAEEATTTDENAATDELEETLEVVDESDTAIYAELLTQAQKDAMVKIAIKNKPKKGNKETAALSKGDQTLFALAKRWGDYKLAGAMLEWLAVAGDNYSKSDFMASIAEILKDKELTSLSEKFSEATYQEDSEEVEAAEAEAAETEAESKVPVTTAPDEVKPASLEEPKTEKLDSTKMDDTSDAAEDDKPKQTYGQLRNELMASFVNRANVVLASEKKAAKEKAKLKAKHQAASN